MTRRLPFLAAVTAALTLTGIARAQIVITALTSTNTLVTFNSTTPGTITGTVPITGVAGTDTLVGIDYRPLDNQLIGLGYNGTTGNASVYAINRTTGVASSINANTLAIGAGLTRVTADFNPAANALRVVTSANTNFRIPTGGTAALATDTPLNPGTPAIRATAYSRNNSGGGTNGATTLYEIDSASGNLVSQGSIDFTGSGGTSPNTGTLSTIAALTGVTAASVVGFDIFNAGGTAAASPGNPFLATNNTLFTLNLTTGVATSVGTIGTGLTILDIAAVPEPGTLALLGAAATGFFGYFIKRRKA